MKTYEKPKLMVLSVSANDALCACVASTRNDAFFQQFDSNNDGRITLDEVNNSGYFGSGGECNISYEKYCKHTPDGLTLFSS